MTLLRHDDMRRQGSHAAYRKAGHVVEQVANDWMPSAAKFEALVIENLKRQLAQAIVELAQYYSHPPKVEMFSALVTVKEQYVATLGEKLESAEIARLRRRAKE